MGIIGSNNWNNYSLTAYLLASSMASSENASAACAETSTEVSELVSGSTTDEDADTFKYK